MKTKSSAARFLTNDRLSGFCRDTAMLLEASIPLYLGYPETYETLPAGDPLREATLQLSRSIEQDGRLSDAMRAQGSFPAHLCDMAAIGEQSGRLDEVMRELSADYARQFEFRRRLNGAVLYPFILLCMMTVVVAVLTFTVLPVFSQVLSRFDMAAAAGTDTVMRLSTVACSVILAVLVLSLVCASAAFALSRTETGTQRLSAVLRRLPATRRVSYDIAAGRLVSGLAALLKSGFTLEDSLRAMLPSVAHPLVAARVQMALESLANGERQDRALTDSALFDPMENHLIVVAGRTGSLDTAADALAARYDERVSDMLDSALSVIEPAMIAALTLVIGAVMLSVMLPLIRIMSAIG